MAKNRYNATFDVPEQEYVLLQPGEYDFTVDSIDFDDYNGSTKIPACPMVIANIHIDTDNGKAFLTNRFYICQECAGLNAAFIKSIGKLKDGQRQFTMDWDSYIGLTGRVKTSQREYNGNMYNQVDRFLPPQKKQQPAKKKSWSDTEW